MRRTTGIAGVFVAGAALLAFTGCRTTVVEPVQRVVPAHHDDHHDDFDHHDDHQPPPPPDHRDDRH